MKKLCSILLSSLLVLGAVCAVSFTGAAATEQATYEVFDFENLSIDGLTKIIGSKGPTLSIETSSPISGRGSLKAIHEITDSGFGTGFALTLGKFDSQKTYRVSGKYRVVAGTYGTTRVLNPSSTSTANIIYQEYFNTAITDSSRLLKVIISATTSMTTAESFSGNISPTQSNGKIILVAKPASNKTGTALFDDITIAEIVAVSAGVNDANMGTATVANKAGHADYAACDTAVFTATPNAGYQFSHWQDATGEQVADTATYEQVITGDTALTAVFVAEQEESAITTAYNDSVAIRTAQASSTGKQGMRVYNSIDQTAGNTAKEYGSIAIRAGYLDTVRAYVGQANAEFDLDLYNAFLQKYGSTPGFGKGVSYQTGGTPLLWETTETEYIFTSYLTGIDKQYYGDTYLIRSYMIDADGNVTYGDIYEASVFNTVYNILQQETEGDGVTAANAIIEEAGQGVYDAWVAEKYPAQ